MLKRHWGVIGVIIVVLVTVAWCWLFVALLGESKQCERIRPFGVVGGRMHDIGGLFDSETEYVLYYRGKHKKTGEACQARLRVTESEYERWMYE